MEKRKISFTEFNLRVQAENAKLLQKYGNRAINIQLLDSAYKSLELGINWSGMRTATAEETRLFINQLNEVTAMAKSLNEEFKDCEVDW